MTIYDKQEYTLFNFTDFIIPVTTQTFTEKKNKNIFIKKYMDLLILRTFQK